jgi:hypothetical protein
MELLTHLRKRLAPFSVAGSVPLLRSFGRFDLDRVNVLTRLGFRYISVNELGKHFNRTVPVDRIRTMCFTGGPLQAKQFKGDYLTFIVDRAMIVVLAKGLAHVEATILYHLEAVDASPTCT